MINHWYSIFIKQKAISLLLLSCLIIGGLLVIPFSFNPFADWFPELNVSVDALPDIGTNQQIIFTTWEGQSPEDVEKHITYPISSFFLSLPGVQSIRAQSSFGKSAVYLIFEDQVDFYWCRSRITEQLSSIPANFLPDGIFPRLGPPATAMGQVFWYSLESRDSVANPISAWSLEELWAIQDYQVKLSLMSVEGVAEVASIGGYEVEYLVEPIPERLAAYDLTILDLSEAIQKSSVDIGARSIEINLAEYYVRATGQINDPSALAESILKLPGARTIRIGDVAKISLAPEERSGILDLNGQETVGGVVTAAFDENPLHVVSLLKDQIKQLEKSLPQRTRPDGKTAYLHLVPHYDRSNLIEESLFTLESTLLLEILITILVISLLMGSVFNSLIIGITVPLSVFGCFVMMRLLHIQANIMSLAGIAIAIGSMVDYGIILSAQIQQDIEKYPLNFNLFESIKKVMRPLLVALGTTLISFIPLFLLDGTAGKLFIPLAQSKTILLVVAGGICLLILPVFMGFWIHFKNKVQEDKYHVKWIVIGLLLGVLVFFWRIAGPESSLFLNLVILLIIFTATKFLFHLLIKKYEQILRTLLKNRKLFFALVVSIVLIGFGLLFRMNRGFMPSFSEGAFIYMPSSAANAGPTHMAGVLSQIDRALELIPEVEKVLGKAGSVESVLDPAPMTMLENLILLKSEYQSNSLGRIAYFKTDSENNFLRDDLGQLIPSAFGKPNRLWRPHIKSEADIWETVLSAASQPTLSKPPKLYPIETRLLMLETGMRSKFGLKIFGSNTDSIHQLAQQLESFLKKQDGILAGSVYLDRMARKPYLEIEIRRSSLQTYGLSVAEVQQVIAAAIGGMKVGEVFEDRTRNRIRIRLPRELRQTPEDISRILIATKSGINVQLGELVDLQFKQGPFVIKSEDGFLCEYLYFDKASDLDDPKFIQKLDNEIAFAIESKIIHLPVNVNFQFEGSFKSTQASARRMAFILPFSLMLILLILWLHFKDLKLIGLVASSIITAVSGGIIFYSFFVPGGEVILSMPVWVGFLVLIGIATDDAVLLASGIQRELKEGKNSFWQAVLKGAQERIRPALLTTTTTIVALLPVLGSSGKGMEILIPMALPVFGGMLFQYLTIFIIPVFFLSIHLKNENLELV